jgi:hypothetical protein
MAPMNSGVGVQAKKGRKRVRMLGVETLGTSLPSGEKRETEAATENCHLAIENCF